MKNFVQSAVNASREVYKILNSGAIAETTKLLANSYHGNQIFIQHTVIKYLIDEETHGAYSSKMFRRLA